MSPRWSPQGLAWTQEWREAAVLIPVFEDKGTEQVVLTRRSEKVAHHKGQICFPGGALEDEDDSLWEAALREAYEEIGLDPHEVMPVKTLKAQHTPTGYRVTPFVGTISLPEQWRPCPNEIDAIFAVPLEHLRNPNNHRFVPREMGGYRYIDAQFDFSDHTIWGMTGRILCEYLDLNPTL